MPTKIGISVERYGVLAEIFGRRKLPVRVYKSAAGFYLGTRTEDGEPFTRESIEYWKKRKHAAEALLGLRKWTQRLQL